MDYKELAIDYRPQRGRGHATAIVLRAPSKIQIRQLVVCSIGCCLECTDHAYCAQYTPQNLSRRGWALEQMSRLEFSIVDLGALWLAVAIPVLILVQR